MKFTYQKLDDGNYEVIMHAALGEKFRRGPIPRRLAYCTHEDDAKCIAEAMTEYEQQS